MKVYEPRLVDQRIHEERRLVRHKGFEAWVVRRLGDDAPQEPHIEVLGAFIHAPQARDLIEVLEKAIELTANPTPTPE